MDEELEEWRPISGLEGIYSVSSLGRVKSEERMVKKDKKGGLRINKERIMSPATLNGYQTLRLGLNGVFKSYYIHSLVLEAFVGPRPTKFDSCHADGVRSNNKLTNLRWDTRKNNHGDKVAHGTTNKGERHQRAKLTEKDVLEMRALRKRGIFYRVIAEKYGVTYGTAFRVINKKLWSHI